MPELILAIDAGTSALGVGLFTPDGRVAGFAKTALRTASPAPGRAEQDAAAVWRAARATIGKALAQAGRAPADVAAIGVTSQRTSIVVWDRRSGRPLTPLVLWNDLRGVDAARALREAGYMVAPQQAAAKLPAVLASAQAGADAVWGNIDSYLIFRLSGAHVTDRSQAWPTGYLNPGTMGWNDALIAEQKLDASRFPALVDTWGPIATTRRPAFGAEVPIAADVADQQAALIAHGEEAGSAKVTFGTSATLNVSTGAELVFRSATAPPFILSVTGGQARFCLEGMVYSAGSAFDWARRSFGLGGLARFEALAASAPDAAGAAFLPALLGLGAPHGDATRRAALVGLTPGVGQAQIARAVMEGVAFRVREVAEHVYGLLEAEPPAALGVDGGLTANRTFLQAQADLLARPLRRHAIAEATAAGAALCAGRGAGLLTDSDARNFVRHDLTVEPAIPPGEAAARFAAWKAAVYG